MFLNNPIESLSHTSINTIRRLKSININTCWDLLNYFPFRYENYARVSKINTIRHGETITVIGTITDAQYQIARTGMRIQKFTMEDGTGTLQLYWYNQPYFLTLLKKGTMLSVAGEVKQFGKQLGMNPKEYEIVTDQDISHLHHTARLVPVYSEIRGLSSKTIREKLWNIIRDVSPQDIGEILPEKLRETYHLMDEAQAYISIHFPESEELKNAARRRLAFDELFILQLASLYVRKEWEQETTIKRFDVDRYAGDVHALIDSLAFALTNAQERVIKEIMEDLSRVRPMNRFLQGEVGSGKTVVAAIGCYITYLNGYQSILMAPTEILAQQHFETFKRVFSAKGGPNIVLLTGTSKPLKNELERANIIIGTHAVIQKNVSFSNVGFVVIDEQHRFGVAQRAELKNKGMNPHVLSMTATPIPRTVVLTLYHNLDMSVIDEMPVGRIPVKTFYVPKEKRSACYEWIKQQIDTYKTQAFIICPLIEESEKESLQSIKAATKEFVFLETKIFPTYKLGLVHGRLTSKEKNKTMADFKNGTYDILVATPVVEVGVDIPNASIMIIEGAERFGLAQLHQLRGRIGRGSRQSYCYVFSEQANDNITGRLQYFAKTTNGSELAQKDVELRGPGTIYGTMQHGFEDLKIASFSDYQLIEDTKNAVDRFVESYRLKDVPPLQQRIELYKIGQIARN